MVGSVERNRIFYDRVLELMLDSELKLNSTDVVRVLTAILVRLSLREAPPEDREALRAQIYNRLIDHEESIKQGQEPLLYSASDIIPDADDMH